MAVRAGVLVDVDGTLVDSNYHHTIAWGGALAAHGHHVHHAVIHRLIGMGGDEMLDELIGHPDEAIADAWRVRFDALLPGIVALDGAAPLLRALHGRGLVVMLATSSPEDLLATMREKIAADDAIDAVVSAGDVEQAKPAPDIFEVGLAKGGLDRDRSFVLGDSRWDVEAAARAGLRCVALECGGTSRSELLDAGALAVYRDPEALLDELDTSPFAVLLQD